MTGKGLLVNVALFDGAIHFTGIVAGEMETAGQTRTPVLVRVK